MPARLTPAERAVLKRFVTLEDADPKGAWGWFHRDIVVAALEAGAQDWELDGMCRNLRRRKLLHGEGSGKFATYYPTDKGREAVED